MVQSKLEFGCGQVFQHDSVICEEFLLPFRKEWRVLYWTGHFPLGEDWFRYQAAALLWPGASCQFHFGCN